VTERRARWVLIFLLSLQLILLSLQVPDPGGRGSRLEAALVRLTAPFPRAVALVAGRVDAVRRRLAQRRALLEENASLRLQVEELRRERVRRFGLEEDLGRLSEALDYARPTPGALQPADIVYVDHASWLQTLLLYVGGRPVTKNEAVVSAAGLVGRVILATGPYAKVQLITDRAASVGAMIVRTRRQGVVRGLARGSLEMVYVPLQADVRPGDQVVSAGIDGIYTRGIPVGTVTRVEPGSELFHHIELAPAVDFGGLDQVYVLRREPVPENLKEPSTDARP